MKKGLFKLLSLVVTLAVVFGAFSIVGSADSETFKAIGGIDLVEYSQNAGRIYFDSPLYDSSLGDVLTNIQALKETDANYNAAVVNGVKKGIKIDGKTVEEYNTTNDYCAMVHFYEQDSYNFIAVYLDATVVNFAEGDYHTIEFTQDFVNYYGQSIEPVVYVYEVATKTWMPEIRSTEAISFPENPGWGNFMGVTFDSNVIQIPEGSDLVTDVLRIAKTDPLYNEAAIESLNTKVLVDNRTVEDWISEFGEDAVRIHMGASDMRIYFDSNVLLFNDEDLTVEIKAGFKTFTGLITSKDVKYFYSSETKKWTEMAPLPVIEIDSGVSYPDQPDWGNFMGVIFKDAIAPADILTDGLITNVQNLKKGDTHYNADVVNSVLNKIIVDGKTIAEWLESNSSAAQIHFGENNIRIYMAPELVSFHDGDVHQVIIEKGFITFTGKRVAETIALNYDPASKTWTTDVVTPQPEPPGEPAEIFSVTDLLVNSGGFANVYFYLTNIINRNPAGTINVQAGGNKIPVEVQNSVLDKIIIDGKSVREWNLENESDYAVMIAYETEGTPQGTFGRLSIWSNVNENTVGFTPDKDHIVEFKEGLLGLNFAPIVPSTWVYSSEEMTWTKLANNPEEGKPNDGSKDSPKTGYDVNLVAVLGVVFGLCIVLNLRKKQFKLIEK